MLLFAAAIPWWFVFSQLFAAFPLHFAMLTSERAVPLIFTVNAVIGVAPMPLSMLVLERLKAPLSERGSEASYLGVLGCSWALGGGAGNYAGTIVIAESVIGF